MLILSWVFWLGWRLCFLAYDAWKSKRNTPNFVSTWWMLFNIVEAVCAVGALVVIRGSFDWGVWVYVAVMLVGSVFMVHQWENKKQITEVSYASALGIYLATSLLAFV